MTSGENRAMSSAEYYSLESMDALAAIARGCRRKRGPTFSGAYMLMLALGYDTWKNGFYIPGQPLPIEVVVRRADH